MISQYRMWLKPEQKCAIKAEWAYRFYAAMLSETSEDFREYVHRDDCVTPISQFLIVHGEKCLWTVNLLGKFAEQELTPIIEEKQWYMLDDGMSFQVEKESCKKIEQFEDLILPEKEKCRLEFCTPTAFRSQKRYMNIPIVPLIMQSLFRQWNAYFPDCQIEDEDGYGMDEIASRIVCYHFRLQDQYYHVKGQTIPGFTGYMELQNHNRGFHKELASALLQFAEYSGIGIKTTLGMGGVKYK